MIALIVADKKITLASHARKRLREKRQEGVTEWDVYAACQRASLMTSNRIPNPLKLTGFRSKAGVRFDIVVVDHDETIRVVTVIGYKYYRKIRHKATTKFRRKR